MSDDAPYSGPPPGHDDFDNMHHALGRVKDPLKPSWRNAFCIELGSEHAKRFEALGWWTKGLTINDGRDAIYRVNDAGRAALAAYLEEGQK